MWRLFGLVIAVFFGAATAGAAQQGFPNPGLAVIGAALAAAGLHLAVKGPQ